jgi:hypothetical protein
VVGKRIWLAIACAAGIAVSGCGGGGGGGVAQPKPVEPISAVVPKFNKAIADQSCAGIEALTFSQTRVNTTPGAPVLPIECQRVKAALAATKDWRFDKSAEYGTAAIMEGPYPKKPPKGAPAHGVLVAIFILDRDRRFRSVVFQPADPQIGTKPSKAAEDNGKNANAILDAVRSRDCKKATPLISPQQTIARGGTRMAACKAIAEGHIFAPALRATKGAKAKLLGATRDIHFYGVATKKTYFTLIMVTPPGTSNGPPLLFDLFANTDNPAIPKRQG